jgi:hypothetical protein
LQGLTRDEAALRLGCPLGTLKSRLERGRAALQKRLTRRGVVLETVLATTLLTGVSAYAVSPGLLARTLGAGSAFAQGSVVQGVVGVTARRLANEFLKSQAVGGIKIVAVCLLIAAAGFGLRRSASISNEPVMSEAEMGSAIAHNDTRADFAIKPPILAHKNNEKVIEGLRGPQRFLNLQPHANQKLADYHGQEGNDLASLPKGVQTMDGVDFNIGQSVILLSGWTTVHDRPASVRGIDVDDTFQRLHILHATHWSAKPRATVAYYTVRYDDKSEESIPIRYGEDVNDWWHNEGATPPSPAQVAWEGENTATCKCGATIRLYKTTWHNPHAARKVHSIDFASVNFQSKDSPEAAPFCVAMTTE